MREIIKNTARIPIAGPWITQKEIDYVSDAVTQCWYDKAHIYHQRFESTFAHYVGRQYGVALPSCTSALHLSLLLAGVGPEDEVIVSHRVNLGRLHVENLGQDERSAHDVRPPGPNKFPTSSTSLRASAIAS